jgi:phage FluMu gp28-like protein
MPRIRRICIDQSGMGLPMYEQLRKEFGTKVEGVNFTLATKEQLATNAKMRMEGHKVAIPDSPTIRNSFRSIKKTTSAAGTARFDAAYDEQYGHGDHFFSFALCENAAHNGGDVYLEWMKRKAERLMRSELA